MTIGVSYYIIKFLKSFNIIKSRGKLSIEKAYKKAFQRDPENFIRYGRAVSVCSAMVSGSLLQANSKDIMNSIIERWNNRGLNKKPSRELKNLIEEALFDAVDIGFLERRDKEIYFLTDIGGKIGRDWIKKMEQGWSAGIKFESE
jgi:hypothetical protein